MEKHRLQPFEKPIYVTRPLLPDIEKVTEHLKEIWDAKWLTNNGAKHIELENKLVEYFKVPYLSLFNNGTIALLTACKCLELKGEVITTPFTFPATTHVLEWNNLKPVFCDIDPYTMNIDATKIEELITPNTSAIMPVHVFGTPCDVVEIDRIAAKNNLKVIYDAAHAFGVEVNGLGIGCYGDVTMLSFHATKLFHTAEGGALLFRDKELKAKSDLLKNFGIKNEEEVVLPGINGKMNEIQAALGISVLEIVNKEIDKRKQLISLYRENLRSIDGISFTEEIDNVKSNYQYFVIRINKERFGKSRDYVYEKMKEYNIFTRKYFYPICSDFVFYAKDKSSGSDKLVVANKVKHEVLSMPLYGELDPEDVIKICNIIKHIRS